MDINVIYVCCLVRQIRVHYLFWTVYTSQSEYTLDTLQTCLMRKIVHYIRFSDTQNPKFIIIIMI